jgi:hypothetical protein
VARGHGIPQGPIASDFLGECFLLPVDEALSSQHTYLRYVDDVRLLGRSEKEVRAAAIDLEIACRDRGLIPQAKKFAIRKVKSLRELLEVVPSVAFAEEGSGLTRPSMSAVRSVSEFRRCLSGRPQRIVDKSRARFVLYRAVPSGRLLNYVLGLLPHHPEHVDAFMFYLNQYQRNVRVVETCSALLTTSPYEYVRGECWQVLARMATRQEMLSLLPRALTEAKSVRAGLSLRWGAATFLCSAEHRTLGHVANWSRLKGSSLLQALIAPILPLSRFRPDDVAPKVLMQSAAEPGLALAERMVRDRVRLRRLGIGSAQLAPVVQRVFRVIGIIRRSIGRTEPIAELLERSLEVTTWPGWQRLLRGEYAHACSLLAQAVPVMASARSLWLIHQNSFNHAVFLAFQRWLSANGQPGTVSLVNARGEMIPFGSLVQVGNQFSRHHPQIAGVFRDMNRRRNSVPAAHPYATQTGRRTVPLRRSEQRAIIPRLRTAFVEIGRVVG